MPHAPTAIAPRHATTPEEVRAAWRQGDEIALLDMRDEGPFSRAHPLFAVSVPLARLELTILRLVPRRDVPVVVYDDGEGYAETALQRLSDLGYTRVSRLAGGLSAWAASGEVFRDVNSYCKAFGELVEARRHTPSLPARDIHALIGGGGDLAIFDVRTFEEYRTMSLPTGQSAPGGELVYRAFDALPDPGTLVVVNCAGRTRSIIGTQSLINAGLPNRVVALRNGTIGWTLAGLALEHDKTARLPAPRPAGLAKAQDAARGVASRAGVRRIDWSQLEQWRTDQTRTLFQLDVRTPEEYANGHLAGFRHAAGGQLVQATDDYVGVRGARIVLADDDGVRAPMTASWLAQMGWRDVAFLDGETTPPVRESGWPDGPYPPLPASAAITPAELADSNALVLDLALSSEFAKHHIPNAIFTPRTQFDALAGRLPAGSPIVLVSADGILAAFAADEAQRAFHRPVRVLAGGTNAWREAGRPIEVGLVRPLVPIDDGYKRPYEGTNNARDAMEAYIAWELGLVAQLERDGTSNFNPL